MRKVSKNQLTTNALLNYIVRNNGVGPRLETYNIRMFASHLASCYDMLAVDNEPTSTIDINSFDVENYKNTQFENCLELHNVISSSEMCESFFLHGSTGDLQYIAGWSDFDAICVLKDSVFEDFAKVIDLAHKLDKIMRKTDMHQHHGIHFVTAREMLSWPQLYLPTFLFRDFVCLLDTKTVKYKEVDSSQEELQRFYEINHTFINAAKTGVLQHHAKDGLYLEENYANQNTMYQMKYLLSVVMLLPSLWLNLIGIQCTKTNSFNEIQKYFTADDLELITKASAIRSSWGREHNLQNNKIPSHVRNILGYDYLKRAASLTTKMVSGLENEDRRL